MGRWTQYDEDEHRLPEGMERIGYDSDNGCYYFRDRDGVVWQGAEGAEFSEMIRVSSGALPTLEEVQYEDLEAAPTRADGYQRLSANAVGTPMAYKKNPDTNAYRTLFPFFLIIAVVLLLVWRLIVSPGLSPPVSTCPKTTTLYWVQPGDSCWDISQTHGCSLDAFKELNRKVDCTVLMPGTTVCLPDPQSAPA